MAETKVPVSQLNAESVSGLAMPSTTYDTLTFPTSGTHEFVAPADGWFYAAGRDTSSANNYIRLMRKFPNQEMPAEVLDLPGNYFGTAAGTDVGVCGMLQVQEGDTLVFNTRYVAPVTLKFYYAQGAVSKSVPVIPDTYTRLQYLQSSGTQYIDTGIAKITSGNIYRMASGVSFADVSTRQCQGCQDFFYWGVTGGYLQMAEGGSNHRSQTLSANTKYDIDAIFDAVTDNVYYSVNGASYRYQSPQFGNTRDGEHFCVFSLNGFNIPFGTANVYYYKLFKNSILQRDLYPVKRNSDNVLGMYDTVADEFLTNAGTGDFTAGPEYVG